MAIGLDPNQIVLNDELLMSQLVQQGNPHSTPCGEGNIQQGGVFGDGKGGGPGDE